jgi:Transcriptional regulator
MSKRLPPLNALRVFDAAARHLSFTKAAEELFVTQAAVSHQIKSLEDFLGLKLFRRRNRSLLLTEEGQSYYLDIKEIFSSINEATRKLQARSAKGALTVSLPPSFAIQWLVPRLSGFNSAYPGIDVRIQAVDREEDKLRRRRCGRFSTRAMTGARRALYANLLRCRELLTASSLNRDDCYHTCCMTFHADWWLYAQWGCNHHGQGRSQPTPLCHAESPKRACIQMCNRSTALCALQVCLSFYWFVDPHL